MMVVNGSIVGILVVMFPAAQGSLENKVGQRPELRESGKGLPHAGAAEGAARVPCPEVEP